MDLRNRSQLLMEALASRCKWGPYQRGEQALFVAAEVAKLSPSFVCLPVGFPFALPLAVLNPANLSRVLVVGFGKKNEEYTMFLPSLAHQTARVGIFEVDVDTVESWLAGKNVRYRTSQQANWSKQEWKDFLPLLKA